MAIQIGADPNWYYHQEQQRSQALASVIDAMQSYEDRKRKRAAEGLKFMADTPGAAEGEFGKMFAEKYGEDPEMLAAFREVQRQNAVRAAFFDKAQESRDTYADLGAATRDARNFEKPLETMGQYAGIGGIGGLLGSAASSMAKPVGQAADEGMRQVLSQDPSGFQQAFAATDPSNQYWIMQELQRVNVPGSRLLPSTERDPLERLVELGELDPSVLTEAAQTKAGLMTSNRFRQEQELRAQSAKELAGIRATEADERQEDRQVFSRELQNERLAAQAERDKAKETRKTYKQKKDEAANVIAQALPVETMPADLLATGEQSAWKTNSAVRERATNRKISELAQKAVERGVDPGLVRKAIELDIQSGATPEAAIASALADLNSGG